MHRRTIAMAEAAVVGGVNDSRFVYNKSKTDVNAAESTDSDTDTNVQLLEENETDPVSTQTYHPGNSPTNIVLILAQQPLKTNA